MSGPIVRSGPSSEYSKNWDSVFAGGTAGKKAAGGSNSKASSGKTAAKASKKAAPAKAKPKKK